MMEDETYCIGVALAAMLLSMFGLLIVSIVGPLIHKKVKDFQLRQKKAEVVEPAQLEKKPILEVGKSVLNAELSLIESTKATTFYTLQCPVYIAAEDIHQWIVDKESSSNDLKLEEVPPRILENAEDLKEPLEPTIIFTEKPKRPKSRKKPVSSSSKSRPKKRTRSKPQTKKRTKSKSKSRKQKQIQSKKSRSRKPKKAITSSSSDTESSSSSDTDSSSSASSSEPKRRSKAKTGRAAASKKKSRKASVSDKVLLKEDLHKESSKGGAARDVETKLVIEKDPVDDNKFDIDYDLTIDPDTKHPMTVHTKAEVDKDKMDVIGSAEAEGSGFADVEGMIRHGGVEDKDDFTLDVKEKSKDKKEMSLHATLKKKQEKMNKKKL